MVILALQENETCHDRWQSFANVVSVSLLSPRRIMLLFGQSARERQSTGVPASLRNTSSPLQLPDCRQTICVEEKRFLPSMKKTLRRLASLLNLRRQARFVASVLPNRYWYRAALVMSRLQGALNGALGANRVLTEAVMLDHWLWELT